MSNGGIGMIVELAKRCRGYYLKALIVLFKQWKKVPFRGVINDEVHRILPK